MLGIQLSAQLHYLSILRERTGLVKRERIDISFGRVWYTREVAKMSEDDNASIRSVM